MFIGINSSATQELPNESSSSSVALSDDEGGLYSGSSSEDISRTVNCCCLVPKCKVSEKGPCSRLSHTSSVTGVLWAVSVLFTIGFYLASILIDGNSRKYCGHNEPLSSSVLKCYPDAKNHLILTYLPLEIPHILTDCALLVFGLMGAMFKNDEAQSPDLWDGLILAAAGIVFWGRVAGTIGAGFVFAGTINTNTSIAEYGQGMAIGGAVFMVFELVFLVIVLALIFCFRGSITGMRNIHN